MDKQTYLLCLGRDLTLLDTRSRVLATRYRVVSLDSLEKLEKLKESSVFQVLVLCHTLSEKECASILHLSNTRWPGIRAVSINTPGVKRLTCQTDAAVDAMDGPVALLNAIADALQ